MTRAPLRHAPARLLRLLAAVALATLATLTLTSPATAEPSAPAGEHHLQSAARPTQYLTAVDGVAVGHKQGSGVDTEWRIDPVSPDAVVIVSPESGEFLGHVDDQVVIGSQPTEWELVDRTGNGLYSIGVPQTDLVLKLDSWADNTPVTLAPYTRSTELLWVPQAA